jgi:hypothetical protein
LSLGLLARAANFRHLGDFGRAQADLEEVQTHATRSTARLHLADYHLERARLHLAQSERDGLMSNLGDARKLIVETGYHRRDAELVELEAQAAQIA